MRHRARGSGRAHLRRRVASIGGVLVLVVGVSGCFMRMPYLTDSTATDAGHATERLNFATPSSTPAPVVTYGPAPGCTGSTAVATLVGGGPIAVGPDTIYQWSAVLGGLTPGTAYCYGVVQGSTTVTDAQFTTPPPPGSTTPYSFAVLGDWGGGTPDEAKVLAQIRSGPAQFVVSAGDNVYEDGTQTDYGDVARGNVFELDYFPAAQSTPFFLANGNHGFDQGLAFQQNWPQGSAAAASGGRYRMDSYCCITGMSSPHQYASSWYAFDWGNARFYVLDAAFSDSTGDGYRADYEAHWKGPVPGCSICGQELSWLQQDLTAHRSTPLKFAFFHYPLHSDGANQASDPYLGGVGGLEGLLATSGVKIAFNGHTHLYERNTPQIPGTEMVSYVTGTGGAELERVGRCSAFDAYAIGLGTSCNAPVPASPDRVHGYLLVTVNGNDVTVTPTDETGRTFDVQHYTFNRTSTSTEELVAPQAVAPARRELCCR